MSSASPSSEDARTNGGAPNTEKPKGKKLSAAKSIALLADNAKTMVEDLAPAMISGVESTDGSDTATLTVTIKYHPASSGASARFDVGGKISVPGVGFSHKAAFKDRGENEDPQLALFAPTTPTEA